MNKKESTRQQNKKLPAEHKGIPGQDPRPQDEQVGNQLSEKDGAVKASMHLPHERDQSVSMTNTGRSPIIKQAFVDEARGLQDTSRQPEMNEAYKKQR